MYVCASSLYSREGCVSSNCLPFDMCVGVALKYKYSSYGRAFCVYYTSNVCVLKEIGLIGCIAANKPPNASVYIGLFLRNSIH